MQSRKRKEPLLFKQSCLDTLLTGRMVQSPFNGTNEPLGQPGSSILYDRYTDINQLLLEPVGTSSAPSGLIAPKESNGSALTGSKLASSVQQAANGKAERQKKSKRKENGKVQGLGSVAGGAGLIDRAVAPNGPAASQPPEKAEQPSPEVDGNNQEASAPMEAPTKKSKKKRDKTVGGGHAEETKAPSGPANSLEAQRIRSIMGITSSPAAEPSQAAQKFGFGFEVNADADGDAEQPGDSAQAGGTDSPAEEAETDREADPEMDKRLQRVMGEAGPSHVKRRVFVGGMPFGYEEADVREYWSYCGEIEELDLMVFPDTGRFKGIAFITFADERGYREALKCNGTMLDEVRLKVEPCISIPAKSKRKKGQKEPERKMHAAPAPKTPGYHVAYVGNIAFEATPEQLKAVFEGCNVKVVRLHTDKHSGKSKGYAHVHFSDEESLDRAMEFNGAPLRGRSIKVGYAQPKKE